MAPPRRSPLSAAPLLLFLALLAAAWIPRTQASWTDGEVAVGQFQAANDALEEASGTFSEGLGEAKTALGSVLGMKNNFLSSLNNAASSLTDDTVATALGGQSALSGIAQTALQAGSLLGRRVAAGAGGAAQQIAEQPEAVVGAFQDGRVVGSGVLGDGAAYGVVPTVAGTTAALQGLVPTPGSIQNEMAVKDAAIAGLATALAQQQQGVAVVEGGGGGVDGGAVVVDGGGGFIDDGSSPVTVVSAAGPAQPIVISPAERRFFDAVSSTLVGALRAVPIVAASSFSEAAAIPAVSAEAAPGPSVPVQQMQAIPMPFPTPVMGGGGIGGGIGSVPTVLPGGLGGLGAGLGGGGGGSGAMTVGTSTPVRVNTPVTVDTPVRQSNSQKEGSRWTFGPPGLGGLADGLGGLASGVGGLGLGRRLLR
jgi:hypothetical protein